MKLNSKNFLMITLNKEKKQFLALVFIYKCLLEISFWKVLTIEYAYFDFSFNFFKYFNGLCWCFGTFALIDLCTKRASMFFLFLIYVVQIIPITAVYSMIPLSSIIYYNILLFSFVLALCIIKDNGKPVTLFKQYHFVSSLILPLFLVVSFFVVTVIFIQKGFPSFDAMDFAKVYILRRDNPLVLGHFLNYIFDAVIKMILPFVLVLSVLKKRYVLTMLSSMATLFIYLHSGHKIIFLSAILCLLIVYYANKVHFFSAFFKSFLMFFSSLSLATIIWPSSEHIFIYLYSFLVRRMLIDPAALKFIHYDYFCSHPFLLLYGAIPRGINPYLPQYYENGISYPYPFEIGSIYFNAPLMSADTGFFAEIFSRFGYLGFPILVILFVFIFKQMDGFQYRTSYRMAVSCFAYPIFALTESPIVGSLFFGAWFFLLLVLCFYSEQRKEKIIAFKEER